MSVMPGCRAARRAARAAASVLLCASASAQCTPFTLPSVWPPSAQAPMPPYVSITTRGGSTLDSVVFVTVGTVTAANNRTIRLGGPGGPNVKSFACANASATIIGFGYTLEATASYLPYGAFAALHRLGPFRCSDGTTNATLLDSQSPNGNNGQAYELPVNLCGGVAGSPSITPTSRPTGGPTACTAWTPPAVWLGRARPPWQRIAAWGGGTLDQIALTNASGTLNMGTLGGTLLAPVFGATCASGAPIVGFSYRTDSSGTATTQSYPYPRYSGIYSIGPFACGDGTLNNTVLYQATGAGGAFPYTIYTMPPYMCGWSSSLSPSISPSVSPSPSISPSPAPTPTKTATNTGTATNTESQGASPSTTTTNTLTASQPATATSSSTVASTGTPSGTPTSPPTASSTVAPSVPTPSTTGTPTASSTASLSVGATPSASPTSSLPAGVSPSNTAMPSDAGTPSPGAVTSPGAPAATPSPADSGGGGGSLAASTDSGGGVAVIAGAAGGGVLVLAAAAAAVVLLRGRRRRAQAATALTSQSSGGGGGGGGGAGSAAAAAIISPLATQRAAAAGSGSFRAPTPAAALARPAAQQASRAPAAPAVASAAADAAPPGHAQASEGLLPGWEAVYSRSKQTWYYKHKGTGETSWTKPAAAAAQAAAPAGGVWVEAMSKSKNMPYWRNSVTGVTTWSNPNK